MARRSEQVFPVKQAELTFLVGIAAVALFISQRIPTAIQAWNLYKDRSPECENIREEDRFNQRYDALIIPGAGTSRISKAKYEPNKQQKLRLEAAGWEYLRMVEESQGGEKPAIILYDEQSEYEHASRIFFQNFVSNKSNGRLEVPDKDIERIEVSNTTETIQDLESLSNQRGWESVAIYSQEFHLDRIKLLLCRYSGISASVFSVEEIMRENNTDAYMSLVVESYSQQSRDREQDEDWKKLVLVLDPDGDMLTWLKEINQTIRHY